jgi:glycosyltransferase involved in cell wall biosynthesis
MKLSVFLPTRNGGQLLDDCLRSILEQDDSDFELVVSDNASDDATPQILSEWEGHPRLRAIRQPELVDVTENWTRALRACEGDYVLMMGDDDYLLPGALRRMRELIEEWDRPDCLTFEGYGFAFPNALDEGSPAYYSDPLFPFDEDLRGRTEISAERRRRLVRDFFRFEFRFCPNLQTTLLSRAALDRMGEEVFKEPYPDFYAMHVLMLLVDRWVKVDDRLVVVGISTKSFGTTLKGGGSDAGRAYLGIETTFPGALPGSDMVNGMHRALEQIEADYRPQLAGIAISRSNYVYRQAYNWYLAFRLGWIDRRELLRRVRLLSARDALGFARELLSRVDLAMLRRHAKPDDDSAIASVWPNMQPLDGVESIAGFAERLAPAGAARR